MACITPITVLLCLLSSGFSLHLVSYPNPITQAPVPLVGNERSYHSVASSQFSYRPLALAPLPQQLSSELTDPDQTWRFRGPRQYVTTRQQLYPLNGWVPLYRPYRSASSFDDESGTVNLYQDRQRFLNWLFGRPAYSPFPDYSPLEAAAGIPHMPSYPHQPLPMYPEHPGMMEECEEIIDPYTHQIYEECQEVMIH